MRLRALQLTVLNLYQVLWAEDAVTSALTMLAASLPHLRVLNVPTYVLVRRNGCPPVGVFAPAAHLYTDLLPSLGCVKHALDMHVAAASVCVQ